MSSEQSEFELSEICDSCSSLAFVPGVSSGLPLRDFVEEVLSILSSAEGRYGRRNGEPSSENYDILSGESCNFLSGANCDILSGDSHRSRRFEVLSDIVLCVLDGKILVVLLLIINPPPRFFILAILSASILACSASRARLISASCSC